MAQLLKTPNENVKKTKLSLFTVHRFLKEKKMFKDVAR